MFRSPEQQPTTPHEERRVLVVDDEPTLRLGFSYALRNPGIRVDTAPGGATALELADAHPYDAMFLDLRMPDIDGLKVIESLRQAGNPVPVVLCSAFVTLESVLLAIRNRVVDFLVKPVRPDDLRHALAYVTGEAGGALANALALARGGRFEESCATLSDPGFSGDARAATWHRLIDLARSGASAEEAGRVLGESVAERIALHAGLE